jgi:hypothetical protein
VKKRLWCLLAAVIWTLACIIGTTRIALSGPIGTPVNTIPSLVTTAGTDSNGFANLASGTITVTSTFQELWAANNARSGCTIVNNGTHIMYVSEGLATTAASTSTAFPVAAGAGYTCGVGGVVLRGQINITGTSGDAFYAAQY